MAYFYRSYDWGIGNDSHSLSISCRGRDLSLTQFHTFATQERTLSLTVLFWTTSKSCQGMYSLKNLSSVLIYLYRSWCSICKQLHWGLSLKNSFQTLLYALQNNSTLSPINNMSFTYTYQKCCSAPTHFLVNTGFTASLYKTYMLWSTYQSVYSNSEMLAPVHRWIAGACIFC